MKVKVSNHCVQRFLERKTDEEEYSKNKAKQKILELFNNDKTIKISYKMNPIKRLFKYDAGVNYDYFYYKNWIMVIDIDKNKIVTMFTYDQDSNFHVPYIKEKPNNKYYNRNNKLKICPECFSNQLQKIRMNREHIKAKCIKCGWTGNAKKPKGIDK
jgi:hypothetical protein